MVLAAPVKLPGKVGNVLRYVAVALGVLETVLDDDEPPPKAKDVADRSSKAVPERSEADEAE